MKFRYNKKQYEVLEIRDIDEQSFGGFVVVVFEITLGRRRFINTFPLDSKDHQSIIENCEYFIAHEFDKSFDELKYLLMEYRKAQIEFNKDIDEGNDTDGSLDRLEYAQSDIYDWVAKNISVEEEDENFWSLNDLIEEMKENDIDFDSQAHIREFLTLKKIPSHIQKELVRDMGFTPFEEEEWR